MLISVAGPHKLEGYADLNPTFRFDADPIRLVTSIDADLDLAHLIRRYSVSLKNNAMDQFGFRSANLETI